MNSPQEQHDDFHVLDDYLERLHRGESPDRDALLREHPELASMLECLDSLENLAPDSDVLSGSGSADPNAPVQSDASAEPLGELPRPFGDYELLEEIGRGGMGVVYKARQESLDRSVAVKMILAGHLGSAEHVRRFQVEAKAAAGLRHSGVVHIHEVGQLGGQHYFAMEYVEGLNLAEHMAKEPLDMDAAAALIGKVARAVHYLHEHGVVHRDLKPSNILLDSDGEPCVTDFGLAKIFAADSKTTATGVIAGTPSYMAPEQAAGHQREVGPASDVYSLGAILYELLTGRPPFQADTPLDTVMQVLGGEPALPRQINSHVPRGLELICLKCLAKSPEDRYATADALADDLARFGKGEALEAKPPHWGQRFVQWTRREPALASRLGALAIFTMVQWSNYARESDDPEFGRFHWKVSLLIVVWAVTAIVFQQGMKSSRWSLPARFVWGTLDSLLLLALLLLADGAASPMVAAYPLLIVGSGLWLRVRFVWFVTALSLISYGILVVDFYAWRTDLQQAFDTNPDRHVIFVVALIVLAGGVSYLVHRIRTLSTFYGQKI